MLETALLKQLRKRGSGGFSLLELLLGIGILAILMVIVSAGISSMTAKTRGVECLAHLKALGGAIQRYAIDHQGLLPVRSQPVNSTTARQWHREVWPLVRDRGDTRQWAAARDAFAKSGFKRWPYHCPGEDRHDSATPGLSYAINENLTDVRVTKLGAKQILLIDFLDRYTAVGTDVQLALRLPNRHGGRNHLLFADYHIEALSADEVPTLTGSPEAWRAPR